MNSFLIDLNHYKNLLLNLKTETENESRLAKDSTKTVELDQSRVGRLSRMDAMQSQAMAVETERRRKIKLQKIDIALKRIEDSEYGYCVSCDEEISKGRLDIDPTSIICVECAGGKN